MNTKTAYSLLFFAALVVLASGCSIPKVPPGSAVSWTHTGNFGPWQTSVTATAIEKQPNGTFKVGHYDGKAGWLGFGVHDVVEGLVIESSQANTIIPGTAQK